MARATHSKVRAMQATPRASAFRVVILAGAVGLTHAPGRGFAQGIAPTPSSAPSAPPAAEPDLVGAALQERGSYEFARGLADDVGARQAGSPASLRAVIWAEAAMKRAGLTAVHREPVQVRRWVRGAIAATLRADPSAAGGSDLPLTALALGGSVATPPAGIEGEVIGVETLEEIAALGARGRGAIVFVNTVMKTEPDGSGYGPVSALRRKGPAAAGRVGARAFLIRSAGTGHHGLAHTGATQYEPGAPKIPAAALSAEDADLLARRLARPSPPRVHLLLQAQDLGQVPSFNVVGEVPSSGKGNDSDEIVLLGAHLDSWDVGRGALDDAAGVAIALDSARLLARLRSGLLRRVRVVLFMSEEMDGAGALAYAKAHEAELSRHVAAIEADSGDGPPRRFGVVAGGINESLVRQWVQPLGAVMPTAVHVIEHGGADLGPLQKAGVPVLDIGQDHTRYFDWHHTTGDTFDKIDPRDLGLATAAFMHLTRSLASAPQRLAVGGAGAPSTK
jgi:carboxypeptidase Q